MRDSAAHILPLPLARTRRPYRPSRHLFLGTEPIRDRFSRSPVDAVTRCSIDRQLRGDIGSQVHHGPTGRIDEATEPSHE